jgi:hypothetical protein
VGGAARRSAAEPQARGLQVTFFQATSIKGVAWVGVLYEVGPRTLNILSEPRMARTIHH